MFRVNGSSETIEVGFYLADQFSIVPFINAADPLRMANRISGKRLFRWRFYSDDGRPVDAINGMTIPAEGPVADAGDVPNMICCIGFDPIMQMRDDLKATLRRLSCKGAHLGALGAGALFLAEAGLLDGYEATIHWRYHESFRERFPRVRISKNLFDIDRDRFTCAGGTAAMDMMVYAIAIHFGRKLASEVSDMYLAGEIRDPVHEQVPMSYTRFGVRNSKLLSIIEMMENNIEQPIPITQLAKRSGLSQRQLERLFSENLQQSPVQFYIARRLEHARRLLMQSDVSVIQIALASGFASHEHFSRSYKAQFGCSPAQERKRCRVSAIDWTAHNADAV